MRSLTLKDLAELDWQRFEDLVGAIVLDEHPGAEQLGGKDGGADVLLERHDGLVRVWQAKHFAGDIRWDQCEKSLDNAVANYAPDQVVFVFPRNLGKVLKDSFAKRLKARHPEVDITYMPGSQILAKLRKREDDLVHEFFGPDPRDQAQAFADHLATHGLRLSRGPEGDLIRHRFELADEAARRDRNFRTEVAIATGEAPLAEWAEQPSLVMTTVEDDRQLRVAVWPEREEDVLDLLFEEGEEGKRARWEVTRQLASQGKARIPKGSTAQLRKVPEAIKAISPTPGVLPDLTLSSVRSHPVKLVGKRGRRRLERTMEVVAVPPMEPPAEGAQNTTLACMDGELSLILDVALREDWGTIAVGLSFFLLEDPDLDSAVEALRLLVALDEGTGHLETPFLPDPVPLQLGPGSEDRVDWNRSILRFFESLVSIRDELGIDGFDLPDEVTEDENEQVVLTARTIEHGKGTYAFVQYGVEVPEEEIAELERVGFGSSVARFPMDIELFGQQLDLGLAEAELPEPSEVRLLEAKQAGKRRVELHWSDPPQVQFKLIEERGAETTETGLWAPGRVPKVPRRRALWRRRRS